MKVHVLLTKEDLSSSEKTVVASTEGELTQDTLVYKEKGSAVTHRVTFDAFGMTIVREAPEKSITRLQNDGRGRFAVKGEYGELEGEAKVYLLEKEEGRWRAEYEVPEGGRMRFEWVITRK